MLTLSERTSTSTASLFSIRYLISINMTCKHTANSDLDIFFPVLSTGREEEPTNAVYG